MKKLFEVSLKATIHKFVKIEAESAEEAVAIAKRDHCKRTMEVDLTPDWLDYAERVEETGELSMEVVGECDNCGRILVSRRNEDDENPHGWPWLYGTPSDAQVGPDKNRFYFTWCYACLQHPLQQLADCAE